MKEVCCELKSTERKSTASLYVSKSEQLLDSSCHEEKSTAVRVILKESESKVHFRSMLDATKGRRI